jgi:uncharacterized protein (TIGR00369 family)
MLHGGVLTTLVDVACGSCLTWSPAPGQSRRVVTLSLTTTFIGRARHGVIRSIGRKKGGGNRIVFSSAEVLDAEGNLVAMGEGTFRYLGAKGLPHPG